MYVQARGATSEREGVDEVTGLRSEGVAGLSSRGSASFPTKLTHPRRKLRGETAPDVTVLRHFLFYFFLFNFFLSGNVALDLTRFGDHLHRSASVFNE